MFVLGVQLRPGAYRAGRPLMQSAPPEPPPTQQNPDAPSSPGRSDLGLSGPLEDGFRELMPFVAQPDDGNVDPSIVERMEREVKELTGVDLEDLLNPSKVVNLELERLKLEAELADFCGDAEEREKLEAKLERRRRLSSPLVDSSSPSTPQGNQQLAVVGRRHRAMRRRLRHRGHPDEQREVPDREADRVLPGSLLLEERSQDQGRGDGGDCALVFRNRSQNPLSSASRDGRTGCPRP